MKKKLLSALLSAAMLLSAVPVVSAETTPEIEAINEAIMSDDYLFDFDYEDDSIDVMLNGEYVEFADQAPALINDRTLVPIRAVVEKMGATVGWDEATQTATVSKGETNLALTIDDPSITVNGEKKALDVAPALINNRTMLPIRAVVEELGCTVGWDDYWQTVIIVDWNAYIAELAEKAPNFYNFMKDTKFTDMTDYVSTMSGKFDFDIDVKSQYSDDVKYDLSLDIASNESVKDGISKSENVIKLDLASLQAFLENTEVITDEYKVDLTQINEVTLDVIADGTNIYVKTNLVRKIANATEDEAIDAAAILFGSSTWIKIDIKDIMAQMGATEEEVAAFTEMMEFFTNPTFDENANALDVMIEMAKSLEYDEEVTAEMIDSIVNAYTTMCSNNHFKYEKAEDGGYTVSMEFDTEDYINLIAAQVAEMGLPVTEEDIAMFTMFKSMFDMLVNMQVVSDKDGNSTGSASMKFGVNYFEDVNNYGKVSFGMDMNSDMKVNAAEAIEIPEKSIDIMKLMEQFKGMGSEDVTAEQEVAVVE